MLSDITILLAAAAAVSSGLHTASNIRSDKLNVHIVAHTHDDVGWLKTVDEYYTGQNNSIQHAYVKMILDTVIECLEADPNRTFSYVEQAFFQRWWRQQGPAIRQLTQRLVAEGRLEMLNGGWCMHDEATPFYLDMIDQTTLGHKFLMDEFGVAPKIGWQIDPFGHSSTQAALLSAEVGFVGLFFGRIDYQDLQLRIQNKKPEFVWRASPSLGEGAQVFSGLTGEYGGNYGPPPGFNWDVGQSDEPVQDDATLTNYNVKSRVDDFVSQALQLASHTRGNNIMFTMGSDFQYEDAREWFENLDRIIKYVNLDGRVNTFYSTPERYLAAKASEDIAWPLKTDDFFPYADFPHAFWGGYFTSRPALKRYVRDTSAVLQVARQICLFGDVGTAGLEKLNEAQGLVQHHDAVSGTEKQHVAFDYAWRLANGRLAAQPSISAGLSKLTGGSQFAVCDLRNVSVCAQTQAVGTASGQVVEIVLWNGLGQTRSEVIELPVGGPNVKVESLDGTEIPSQIVASLPSITNYGEPAGGSAETILFAASLPAMGYTTVRLRSTSQRTQVTEAHVGGGFERLENKYLSIQFCGGSICKIVDVVTGVSIQANQSWLWYNSSVGNDVSNQKSGAYLFRPNKTEAFPVSTSAPTLSVVRGPVADEVHQTFGSWVSQRIRLVHTAKHAEITFTVGEIPIEDGWGKEIVSRITTDLKTNGECFTDSNGREMIYRKRDYRPSWKFNQTEPVAGNYFPVNTALFIKDEQKTQLTLLTDTSQAGSGCVRDGEVELMVHRRVLVDDSRGVGEPLNETKYVSPYVKGYKQGAHFGPGLVVRGKHLLTFTSSVPSRSAAEIWRPVMDRLYMPALPFFNIGEAAITKDSFTAIAPLPSNVALLTLMNWDDKQILLRLGHQFGVDEDPQLSKPVTIDMSSFFLHYNVLSLSERGLAATITRDEVLKRRIPWKIDNEVIPSKADSAESTARSLEKITLGPLQIRTFLLQLSPKATDDFIRYI